MGFHFKGYIGIYGVCFMVFICCINCNLFALLDYRESARTNQAHIYIFASCNVASKHAADHRFLFYVFLKPLHANKIFAFSYDNDMHTINKYPIILWQYMYTA